LRVYKQDLKTEVIPLHRPRPRFFWARN